jgi:hypothetical protein
MFLEDLVEHMGGSSLAPCASFQLPTQLAFHPWSCVPVTQPHPPPAGGVAQTRFPSALHSEMQPACCLNLGFKLDAPFPLLSLLSEVCVVLSPIWVPCPKPRGLVSLDCQALERTF